MGKVGPSQISLVVLFLIRRDLGQKKFMENLLLFVTKGYMPIFVVEN